MPVRVKGATHGYGLLDYNAMGGPSGVILQSHLPKERGKFLSNLLRCNLRATKMANAM